MVILLSEIESVCLVKGEIERGLLPASKGEGFDFLTPIGYEIGITKVENGAKLKGRVSCSLSLPCSRCLENFSLEIDTTLDVDLILKPTFEEKEIELISDEMDIYFFDGEKIDIVPIVYDEVMLSIPIKPLCQEGCRGLCPTCGNNLNIEECQCNKVSYTLLEEKLKSFLTRQGDDYGSPKKKNITIKKG
ncbi:MAG: DUF177 domain-containing protein [Syntrophorhabdaceae bacterium]|nr:DUF177 domain-containing protein [Syntrophorhabdaceae bacterium]